jgi:hypothetical protein
MQLLHKKHKGSQLKKILNSDLVFIFHHNGFTVNSQNQLKKTLNPNKLKTYLSNQSLFKKVLKKTNYSNISLLLNGPVLIIYGNFHKDFNNLYAIMKKLPKTITLIGFKNGSTFYNTDRILNIIKINKKFYRKTDKNEIYSSLRAFNQIITKLEITTLKLLDIQKKL